MPGFRHVFSTSRVTYPDLPSLIAAVQAVAGPTAGVYESRPAEFTVKKDTVFTSAEIASCQTAIDTAPARTPQRTAQNFVDRMPLFEKVLLLTLLDQINVLRGRAGLSAITPAQAVQAVRDKISTL